MSFIDVDALLAPITEAEPCGASIVYEAPYLEIEELTKSAPAEEQMLPDGEVRVIRAARTPNWKEVGPRCRELLRQTKDLRLIYLLTMAGLEIDGVGALRDGLTLLRQTLERHWDHLHPRLDPDLDNDPADRMNLVEALAGEQLVRQLRAAPLANSRQIGRFCQRDVMIASGELPVPPPKEGEPPPPDKALINAAFDDTSLEDLTAAREAVQAAADEVTALDQFLMETVGSTQAPQLADLSRAINEVAATLTEHLTRRGVEVPGAEGEAGAVPVARIAGEITSREDVVMALDKICRYYDANEPSSPIPPLLRRAQRLVARDFIELVKDLAPGAMSQLEVIFGQDQSGS